MSRSYGRELSGARIQAMEVERINDDPPERMATWRETVSPSALRALDLLLLTDLLRIEDDPASWSELMRPVIAQIEDLLLVGDFDAADQLRFGCRPGSRAERDARTPGRSRLGHPAARGRSHDATHRVASRHDR